MTQVELLVFSMLEYEDVQRYRYIPKEEGTIYDTFAKDNVKICTGSDGCDYVRLYTEWGRAQKYQVNRVIASAFVKKTKRDIKHERNIVHAKDWDKQNHNYKNLEWVNPSELQMMRTLRDYEKEDSIEVVKDQSEFYLKRLIKKEYNIKDIKRILPRISIFTILKYKFIYHVVDKDLM